jgi:hypothetical protein
MARPTKMSVQKRARERKKSEAAELKRTQRGTGGAEKPAGGQVAERSDLEGYGVIPTFSGER